MGEMNGEKHFQNQHHWKVGEHWLTSIIHVNTNDLVETLLLD